MKMMFPDDLPQLIAKEERLQWWNNTINIVNVSLVALTFFVTLMSNRLGVWLSAATDERTKKEKQISDQKIASSNERASSAIAMSENSKVEQQKLAIELAEAKQKQAETELKLIEVQKWQAPRHLTEQQRISLINSLKGSIVGPIRIIYAAVDDEARAYSVEIINALKEAGWESKLSGTRAAGDSGIEILVNDKKEPAHAQILRNAFKKAGIQYKSNIDPVMPIDAVGIYFANKPKL